MLAMMIAAALLIQTPADEPPEDNWTGYPPGVWLWQDLYQNTSVVSGRKFCDRAFGRRMADAFDRRYGARVIALLNADAARPQPPPRTFLETTDCLNVQGKAQAGRVIAWNLDAFEPTLRRLEQTFGGY